MTETSRAVAEALFQTFKTAFQKFASEDKVAAKDFWKNISSLIEKDLEGAT